MILLTWKATEATDLFKKPPWFSFPNHHPEPRPYSSSEELLALLNQWEPQTKPRELSGAEIRVGWIQRTDLPIPWPSLWLITKLSDGTIVCHFLFSGNLPTKMNNTKWLLQCKCSCVASELLINHLWWEDNGGFELPHKYLLYPNSTDFHSTTPI